MGVRWMWGVTIYIVEMRCGEAVPVAVPEGQVRQGRAGGNRGHAVEVRVEGDGGVGPVVSRSRIESAWLASAAGESGLRGGSAGAVTGLLFEEGQRTPGEDVGERVEGDDRPVRWGGLVGEVSASRWLPAQGST